MQHPQHLQGFPAPLAAQAAPVEVQQSQHRAQPVVLVRQPSVPPTPQDAPSNPLQPQEQHVPLVSMQHLPVLLEPLSQADQTQQQQQQQPSMSGEHLGSSSAMLCNHMQGVKHMHGFNAA